MPILLLTTLRSLSDATIWRDCQRPFLRLHFISRRTRLTAKELAYLFRTYFVRHHGFALHVVLDRGSQFVAQFWRNMCFDSGISSQLMCAYQPSFDSHVEEIDTVLEGVPWTYVDNLHNDWDEFATAHPSGMTPHGMTPLPLLYTYGPVSFNLTLSRTLPVLVARGPNPGTHTTTSRRGRCYAISWATTFQSARELLQTAKDLMRDSTIRLCIDRQFNVGELVILNTEMWRLTKKPSPSGKILPRFCGPFRIPTRVGLSANKLTLPTACISAREGLSAYKLTLPTACKIHPVVHVSKLWLYTPRHDQRNPPLLPYSHCETFQVLDILSHRGTPTQRQYLVQWTGTDCMYTTWKPKSYEERSFAIAPSRAVYTCLPGKSELFGNKASRRREPTG